MKTVITNAGLKKFITTGTGGPKLNITSVKIGSTVLNPLSTMEDVTDEVWSGDSQFISYQVLDDNTFAFVVTLDESIGNFQIGNIGLFIEDGTMFCLTTLLQPEQKTKNESTVVGNRFEYVIPIILSGISDAVQVSYIVPDEASLPVVYTEASLPDYRQTNYSAYVVQNFSLQNVPALAMRTSTGWSFLTAVNIGSLSSLPSIATFKKDFTTSNFSADANSGLYAMTIPFSEHHIQGDVSAQYVKKKVDDGYVSADYSRFKVLNNADFQLFAEQPFDGQIKLVG